MEWIGAGLYFECQPDCGKCCSNAREGVVYLEPVDLERLARRFGIDPHEALEKFATTDRDGDLELAKTPDGHCVFLDGYQCAVYEDRPLQCRAYPFLPLDGYSPLDSEQSWREESEFCPGIGKGRLYPLEEIKAISRGARLR